jgi:GT2 family glycosyltransferase
VSILVPTTGNPTLLEPCLNSLLTRTTYGNFEVLVLVNETHRKIPERACLLDRVVADGRIRVLDFPDRPFNYSWVNNRGADQASGDILCLLNDDTELVTGDWLEQLVARVALDGVGAAGPMLYYPDNTIQHAGTILGIGGVADHVFRSAARGHLGYFGRACLEQDLSCITAGCMAMRASVYRDLGGFNEELAIAFNDVDLCLRIRAAGWRIIWTPAVELTHRESTSLGRHDAPERAERFSQDVVWMRGRWGPALDADPFYNRNLSLTRPYELAFPPRTVPRCRLNIRGAGR